jgi:hypothetical protein
MEATTSAAGSLATVQRFNQLMMEAERLLHLADGTERRDADAAAAKIAEARRLLADELVVHEPPGLPYGGEYHGPDGFFELFGKITGSLDLRVKEHALREAGDIAVTHAVMTFTLHASGQSVETSVCELATVRGGQIVDLDIYYKDPGAVATLMQGDRR